MDSTIINWLIETAQARGVSLTILFIILFKEIPAVKAWLDAWYRRRIELDNEDRKRAAEMAERQVKAWERLSEQMSNMNLAFISMAQRMERVEDDIGSMSADLLVVADRMGVKPRTQLRRETKHPAE